MESFFWGGGRWGRTLVPPPLNPHMTSIDHQLSQVGPGVSYPMLSKLRALRHNDSAEQDRQHQQQNNWTNKSVNK